MRRRVRAWREIFWKPLVGVVLALYGFVQLWQVIRGELRPDIQEPLRIYHLLPDLSAQAWIIGWLALLLVITLEGGYRAITRRDTLTGGAAGRLTALREEAIAHLLNRPVRTDQELETLKSDFDDWTHRTLAELEDCATPSEASSFRVLGALPGSHWSDSFNPEHNRVKIMVDLRVQRLTKIADRLGSARPQS